MVTLNLTVDQATSLVDCLQNYLHHAGEVRDAIEAQSPNDHELTEPDIIEHHERLAQIGQATAEQVILGERPLRFGGQWLEIATIGLARWQKSHGLAQNK